MVSHTSNLALGIYNISVSFSYFDHLSFIPFNPHPPSPGRVGRSQRGFSCTHTYIYIYIYYIRIYYLYIYSRQVFLDSCSLDKGKRVRVGGVENGVAKGKANKGPRDEARGKLKRSGEQMGKGEGGGQ